MGPFYPSTIANKNIINTPLLMISQKQPQKKNIDFYLDRIKKIDQPICSHIRAASIVFLLIGMIIFS
jgi:hypothetical protein